PAPNTSFWEYRHSGPLRDRAAWGKYARVPSTLPHESGRSSAPRLGVSGQITCQTRAVRSLVNDSEPTGEPVRGNEVRCLVQPGDSYKVRVSILWRHPPHEHDTTRGLRADDRGNPWQQRVGWASQ